MVEVELSSGWRLAVGSGAPELALAARELEHALGTPGDGGVEVALSHDEGEGDGFRRRASRERVDVHGESPRAGLLGTYAFLEELGCAWPWPGESRPASDRARLVEEVESAPALPGRCLVLGERSLVEQAEDWIAWAARNRLNSVFVHTSADAEPVGAAPEAAWEERRKVAIAAARARGMRLEHGGHLLPALLPEGEIKAVAQGAPLGERGRHAVEAHVRAHPEAELLHLWGVDLPASVQRGREASEAALRTANALAAVTETIRAEAAVAFLAYHETEEVPRGVSPHHNVSLVFAPRERCYEHPLADPGCRTNARHRALLEAQIEHFGQTDSPPRVFEYWFDAIRFRDGIPDLSETIAADLDFYRQAGVHTVQMLITGHGRSPAPHPNPVAFARHAWGPG